MFWIYQSRRWDLLVRCLAVLAVIVYLLLVRLCAEALVPYVRHTVRWPAAFGLLQIALLALGIASLALTKYLREARDARRDARRPRIEELLVAWTASDSDDDSELLASFRRSPSDFIEVLGSALHRVRGQSLHRLQELARCEKIAHYVLRESHRRHPQRIASALHVLSRAGSEQALQRLLHLCADSRRPIRLLARRLTVRYGPPTSQLRILTELSSRRLWERIQVFQQLPPDSPVIHEYVADAWRSSDDTVVIGALELVLTLQRYFVVDCPSHLATHRNLEVRIRFFRALPFLAAPAQASELLRAGLRDSDWRVRAIAARATGVMRVAALGAELMERCRSAEHSAEAGHAARALGCLGGANWEQLRMLVNGGGMTGRQVAHVMERTMTPGAAR